MKSPYTFPHKSRKAMLQYLTDHESYYPMNSWNRGFVLSWNVKIYHCDYSGKMWKDAFPIQSRFDKQWDDYCNENSELFWECCADAARLFTDKEWSKWSNYPGIEQGEWEFSLNGRSGGHMILTEAPGWFPAPCRWKMHSMIWSDRGDYEEWIKELDTKTLKRFYRAIRVLDHDLRWEACESKVSYYFAMRRHDWEQGLIAEEDCNARKQEESRPDLYQS